LTSAANVHDREALPYLLHGNETRVWGDQGYQGQTAVIRTSAPHPKDFTDRRYRYHGRINLRPLLKSTVHRLVVRAGPRKHVPLGPRAEDPQYRLEHVESRNRLAARTIVGIVLLRKVLPDQLPRCVR
jgi:hypothetical protein